MPGFRSHYFFGKNTYDALEKQNQLPECVKRHPTVFFLGEQGPDMFFYSPQAHLFYKKNIGMAMHSSNVNKVFEGMLDYRRDMTVASTGEYEWSGADDYLSIVDAYIMGFMGHYTLDTACHPYINWRQEKFKYIGHFTEGFGVHVLLETDIDNDNVRHFLGVEPSQFNHYDTIKVTKHERAVTAGLIESAINYAFPEQNQKVKHIESAITMSRKLFKWMVDRHGIKKALVVAFDKLFFHHIFLSAVISNDDKQTNADPCNLEHRQWYNLWDESKTSTKDFYQLMDDAEEVYKKRIALYADYVKGLKEGDASDDKIKQLLLSDLGDNSYDSGLPWEETKNIMFTRAQS